MNILTSISPSNLVVTSLGCGTCEIKLKNTQPFLLGERSLYSLFLETT